MPGFVHDIKYKGKTALLLAVFFAFLAFYPSLTNDFVNYDDPTLILNNDIIHSFSIENSIAIFQTQIDGRYSRFNPLVFVMYSAIYNLVGAEPFLFHFVNFIFHIGCTICTFLLVRLFTDKTGIAFFAALLFGIHPIHVEPVAWISALTHVMYTFFYLLGLIFFILWIKGQRKKIQYFVLTLVSCIFSGMCFSGGTITFPLMLIIIVLFLEGRWQWKRAVSLIPFFIISGLLVYFTVHNVVYSDIIDNPYVNTQTYSLESRVHLSSVSLFRYIQQLAFPYRFSIVYPTGYFFHNSNFLLTIAGLLLYTAFITKRKNFPLKFFHFGILFFGVTILPFLQLYSSSSSITSDRYVYLASVGIFLILAEAIDRIFKKGLNGPKSKISSVKIVLSCYLVYILILGWTQCYVWRNTERLWTNVIDLYPKAYPAYLARSKYYFSILDVENGARDLEQAYRLEPDIKKWPQ